MDDHYAINRKSIRCGALVFSANLVEYDGAAYTDCKNTSLTARPELPRIRASVDLVFFQPTLSLDLYQDKNRLMVRAICQFSHTEESGRWPLVQSFNGLQAF